MFYKLKHKSEVLYNETLHPYIILHSYSKELSKVLTTQQDNHSTMFNIILINHYMSFLLFKDNKYDINITWC